MKYAFSIACHDSRHGECEREDDCACYCHWPDPLDQALDEVEPEPDK